MNRERSSLASTVIVGVVVAFSTAAAAATQKVTPAHVYQATGQVGAAIELVREVMGRPTLAAPPWKVDHAEPRHVLYQAQAMFRKVNRLAEQLRLPAVDSPPIPAEAEIEPADVIRFVHGAYDQLGRIRIELGIAQAPELPPFDALVAPRDVLREVVQASRQVNLMLDTPIQPADVYARMELTVAHVAAALSEDSAVPSYGTLPDFKGGKTPADVYRRVLECLGLAQTIGAGQGIDVLQLDLRHELRRSDLVPVDVYHLTTTVLAEVAHLALVLDAEDADLPPVERPKHIFPSHVYRMAGLLLNSLRQLEDRLEES